MGVFDWLRKPKATVSLPQICYDVAYFILPHYAFRDLDKLADLCLNTPTQAGPFFYVMAARARKVGPDLDEAKRFRWHHGQLCEGHEYFTLEYPVRPPVDVPDLPNKRGAGEVAFMLAPYFSAIVRGTDKTRYFILGQRPLGGGTTLRSILPEGKNCNLGPGPEPELAAFLAAVRERVAGQAEPGAAADDGSMQRSWNS